jgi:hypothetical protein
MQHHVDRCSLTRYRFPSTCIRTHPWRLGKAGRLNMRFQPLIICTKRSPSAWETPNQTAIHKTGMFLLRTQLWICRSRRKEQGWDPSARYLSREHCPFPMRPSEIAHRALEPKYFLPTTSSQQSLSLKAGHKTTKRDSSSAICLMPTLEACRPHCECRSVHASS